MQDFVIVGAAAAGSRLHLAGPPYYEQFQVGALQEQEHPHPVRQFADCGAGVVRDAHGRLFLGYDVGGKVPQRRGHGPRTHSLQRQVHELALGSLVDHGAQQNVVLRIRSFTTDQGVKAKMVTEGIETALIFSKCIGVQLPGDVVARGLIFPFLEAITS